MRIGLISDTHGNLDGWQRAWDLVLSQAEVIIHAGDVLYHGPKFTPTPAYAPKDLADAINSAPMPVLIARGNCDADVDQLVLEVPLHQPYLLAQWGEVRLLATHGHLLPLADAVALAQKWDVDFLVTGHTHVPLVRRIGSLTHVNPGSPTYPLAQDEKLRRTTCAMIEDGQVMVLDLDSGASLLTNC